MTANPSTRHSSPRRGLREAQGRLFWVWAFSIPVVGIMFASLAFGTPWPSPFLRNLGFLVFAFPVLFVVGREEMRATPARRGGGRTIAGLLVAALVLAGYLSGLLSLVAAIPNLAGIAALVMAAYSTMCYLKGRDAPTQSDADVPDGPIQ